MKRLALLLILLAVPRAWAGPDDMRSVAARLREDTDLLQKQVDLANGKNYYLILDARAGSLKLLLQGVTLREYPVKSLRIGRPRVFFAARGAPDDWETRIWSDGTLDPVRDLEHRELAVSVKQAQADADTGDALMAVVPPTPEEACPTPEMFCVRYSGGLALEFRKSEVQPDLPFWKRLQVRAVNQVRTAAAVLASRHGSELHVRIALPVDDTEALYRSLPPDTKFLLIPPEAGG